MSPVKVLHQNIMHQKSNTSPVKVLHQNIMHQKANMSPAKVLRQNQSKLIANMSIERHNKKKISDRLQNKLFRATDQEWDWNHPCIYCGCIFLTTEHKEWRKHCCQNGQWKTEESGYPLLEPLPDVIRNLCENETAHFSSRSNLYNNLLSFSITGVDNGREGVGYEVFNMNASVKLNGRIYHKFPVIQGRENNGITNFIHDVKYHVDHINGVTTKIYENIAEELQEFFRIENIYGRDLTSIHDYMESLGAEAISELPIDYISEANVAMNQFEIGIILNQDATLENRYYFKKKTIFGGTVDALIPGSNEIEPLCYPLLHPYAEKGWGSNLKRFKIHHMPYVMGRLLQPEGRLDEINRQLIIRNQTNTRDLNINRFQSMARLTQFYCLENMSQAIDEQLRFQKQNQQYFMGNTPHVSRDSVPIDADRIISDYSSKSFLSSSIAGINDSIMLLYYIND